MHAKNQNCSPKTVVESFETTVNEPLRQMNKLEPNARITLDRVWGGERRYSEMGTTAPMEGWTDGRLWEKGTNQAKELWRSSINLDHCLAVAEGRGWKY